MSDNEATSSASIVVGFGKNYYHNFGPAQRVSLNHAVEGELDGNSSSLSANGLSSYQFLRTDEKEENSPTPPWEEDNDPLVDVQCTSASTHFLTKSGRIYKCGTVHGHISPSLSKIVIALPLKCIQLAAGRHFCLGRMEGGLAVCAWGAGHFGQLGLGGGYDEHDSESPKTSSPPSFVARPTVVEALLPHVVGAPVGNVAAGYWHSMAVTKDGNLYAWGCNRNAQCGKKPSSKEPPTICQPQRVSFDTAEQEESSGTRKRIKIQKIAAGRSHSVVLDSQGHCYSWGANQYGQCGILTRRRTAGVPSPKHVDALAKVRLVDISAGDLHTLALTGGGRVFAWGGGFEGQLGTGYIYEMNPKPKLINDLDFVAIEAGQEWKSIQKDRPIPLEIGSSSTRSINLDKTPRITSVIAKGNSSFAVSSTGHVYAWGSNDVGHLGLPRADILTYADPGQAGSKPTSIQRQFHTYSFDSSHNVAIPERLDSLRHLHITALGASSTFMWCLGTERDNDSDPVGRTLYEIQQANKSQAKAFVTGTFGTKLPSKEVEPNAETKAVGMTDWKRTQSSEDKKVSSAKTVDSSLAKATGSKATIEAVGGASNLSPEAKLAASATVSPPTGGKKKRLFSPKKVVKAFVRRASGSTRNDRASLPSIDIEEGGDAKPTAKTK